MTKTVGTQRQRKNKMTDTPSLFSGIISGERRRGHGEVADRAARMAGGFERIGVKQGDSVCILMRNDIAFIEAAYGAMQLGAYAVPVNWHFKPEEIRYILGGFRHARSGRPCRHAASAARRDPRRRHRSQRADAAGNPGSLQDRSRSSRHARFRGRPRILAAGAAALCGPGAAAAGQHDLHLGHDRSSEGGPSPRADAGAERVGRADARDDLRTSAGDAGTAAGAAVSFGAEFVRPARRTPRRRAGPDAAVRSGGIFGAGRGRAGRLHLHGADHVRPADEAAGECAPEIRHFLAAPRRPCRGALPRRRQARDDRMVGAGDP